MLKSPPETLEYHWILLRLPGTPLRPPKILWILLPLNTSGTPWNPLKSLYKMFWNNLICSLCPYESRWNPSKCLWNPLGFSGATMKIPWNLLKHCWNSPETSWNLFKPLKLLKTSWNFTRFPWDRPLSPYQKKPYKFCETQQKKSSKASWHPPRNPCEIHPDTL